MRRKNQSARIPSRNHGRQSVQPSPRTAHEPRVGLIAFGIKQSLVINTLITNGVRGCRWEFLKADRRLNLLIRIVLLIIDNERFVIPGELANANGAKFALTGFLVVRAVDS
jgi:hypothetical protein